MKKITNLLLFLLCANVVVGQFGPQNNLTIDVEQPRHIISTDIDFDGNQDVLCASNWNSYVRITLHLNLGNGMFDHGKQIITDCRGDYVLPIDIDGDGDDDIVYTPNSNMSLVWNENLGGGNFDTLQRIIDTNIIDVRVAVKLDFDLDGDLDIISGGGTLTNTIRLHENLGNGNFSTGILITSNVNFIKSLAVGDIDNDGDNDLVSASYLDDKIAWYENLGTGFGPQQIITTSADGVNTVFVVDIDNDLDKDILYTSGNNGLVSWLENMGSGVFNNNLIDYGINNPHSILASDTDNDGDEDIYMIGDGDILMYENNGVGVFSPRVIISTIPSICLISTDINGDGNIDIVSGDNGDRIVWRENQGANIFGDYDVIAARAEWASSVFSEDLDGDGDKDILSSSSGDNKIAWYENLGAGRFSNQKIIDENINGASSVYSADLDNDGDFDIISAAEYSHRIKWFENIGNGNFVYSGTTSNNASNVKSIVVEDMDNDGNIDIVAGCGNKITWYKNLGGLLFSAEQIVNSNTWAAQSVYTYDLDNDGDQDIIAACNNRFLWHENLGNGSFSAEKIISYSTTAYSVFVADLDNDGDGDIITGENQENKIGWHQNLGAGVIDTNKIIISNSAVGVRAVYSFDVDNDGDMDVLSSLHMSGKNIWFENLGGIIDTTQHIIDSLAQGAYFIHANDFDNDGDLDIVSALLNAKNIVWYKNGFISSYQLKGKIFYDENQNGIIDSNDIGLPFIQTQLQPNGIASFTSYMGNYFYSINDTLSTYTVSYKQDTLWNLTTDSISYNRTLSSLNSVADSLNFGFYPDTILTILQPELTGGFPRCNDTINYWISFKNVGTTRPRGVIELQLDDSVIYISSTIIPDSTVGQSLYWHYDSLYFYHDVIFSVQVEMPSFTNMGDTLVSNLTVSEIDTLGNTVYNISDSLKQVSVCAYDPNDKKVIPEGVTSKGYITNNQELEYLIRFQNTGNDTAVTIIIKDTLDSNCDWMSLTPVAHSHNMQVSLNQGGEIEFKFENIMLPDSGVDFLGSQGFVKFKINMIPNLVPGTQIHNTANIYFDSNPPVITNTVLNTIFDCIYSPIILLNTSFCVGDSLMAYSEETDLNNYFWEIGAFYNTTDDTLSWITDTVGVFNIKLTSSNIFCAKDTTISITVNPLPNVTIANFNPDTICSSSSAVTLPNGSPLGGVYSGTGVNGGTFDPNTAGLGTHSVIYTYTDVNSCINSDSTFITVEQCVGIDDLKNDLGILIYPNPNTGLFTIEKPMELDKEVNISLLDASSRVIIDKLIPKGQQKIEMDITSYSKGVYYLQLTIGDKVYVKQILKN